MINYILLVSRQGEYTYVVDWSSSSRSRPYILGRVRLAKWYTTLPNKTKTTTVRDITQLVLNRKPKMCNVLEYKGDPKLSALLTTTDRLFFFLKPVGSIQGERRYASLFFIAEIDSTDNELTTLEILHRYVEVLDKLFGNVCELDLIFNYDSAYYILDELILGGELQETSKTVLVKTVQRAKWEEKEEIVREGLSSAGML